MITALSFLGVPPVTALAMSILFGIVMSVVGLAGGVVWLTSDGKRPKIRAFIGQTRVLR